MSYEADPSNFDITKLDLSFNDKYILKGWGLGYWAEGEFYFDHEIVEQIEENHK
jgi:hypothetical protein